MTNEQIRNLNIDTFDHDDDLLSAVLDERRPRIRVYSLAETVVVLGRGSKPLVELDLDACLEDGIPLLKRHGGGCAVVIDPGNVIVSVALPIHGLGNNMLAFAQLSRWIGQGLARIGVDGVYHDGISDLVRRDHKVGGACIYRRRDLLYYSGTLLVSPDISRMERYLKHPPREPLYRRGRRHADFVRGLSDKLDVDTAIRDLRRHLDLQALELVRGE